MGGRAKRQRGGSIMHADAVQEAWREMELEQEVGVEAPQCPQSVRRQRYDQAVTAAETTNTTPRDAAALVWALRPALAFGVESAAWLTYLDHHLSAAVRSLRSEDEEFAAVRNAAHIKWRSRIQCQGPAAASVAHGTDSGARHHR